MSEIDATPVAPNPELEDGDTLITNAGGKVIQMFNQPVSGMRYDPQNAQQIGAAMAAHAYEAHFGRPAPDAPSAMLAQYVKERAVDAVRITLITRVSHIIRSGVDQKLTPGTIAMNAVDAVLREVT